MDDDSIDVCSCILVMRLQDNIHQSREHCWGPVEAKWEDPLLRVP